MQKTVLNTFNFSEIIIFTWSNEAIFIMPVVKLIATHSYNAML